MGDFPADKRLLLQLVWQIGLSTLKILTVHYMYRHWEVLFSSSIPFVFGNWRFTMVGSKWSNQQQSPIRRKKTMSKPLLSEVQDVGWIEVWTGHTSSTLIISHNMHRKECFLIQRCMDLPHAPFTPYKRFDPHIWRNHCGECPSDLNNGRVTILIWSNATFHFSIPRLGSHLSFFCLSINSSHSSRV